MNKKCIITSIMSLVLLVAMVFLIIFHLPSNKPDVTCDDFDLDDIPQVSNKQSAIVIVGAGPAGLAAASKLIRSGFLDVKILEASNRTGGRVHSSSEFGRSHGYVELGAQFIHGEEGNVVFKLAKDSEFVDLSESEITETFSISKSMRDLDEIIEDKLLDMYDKVWDDIMENASIPNQSVGVYADEKFNEVKQRADHDVKEYIPSLRDLCHRAIQNTDGCKDWYDVSYDTEYEDCEGNQGISFKKEHKYEDVLQIFKNDIPNSKFHFETTDKKIDYTGDNIKIVSKDGSEFLVDIMIFTGSLGVLKEKGDDMFYPQLPIDKLQAIEEIGFGIVDKIYLEFSSKVFDSNTGWKEFLFDDDSISYSAEDAFNDWTRFLSAYYVIDETLASFWLSGEGAKYMETLSEDKVKNDLMKRLREFKLDLPEPIKIAITRWNSDQNMFGSYSYQTVNSSKIGVGPRNLAKPIGNGQILFAGEATNERHYSTVHGAVESGWREANRIICSLTKE